MALRKVQSGAIADNAITSAKIASGAVTASDIAAGAAVPSQTGNSGKYLKTDGTASSWEEVPVPTPTAVSDQANTSTGYFNLPAGTTEQRPATPIAGMLRFNTTIGKSEQYDGTTWAAIDAPPVINSVSTNSFVNSTDTITLLGSNFSIGSTISFIAADGSTILPSTVVRDSSLSITATFGASMITAGQTSGKDPFDVRVTNTSGLFTTFASQINYNPNPTWNTTSGSLVTILNSDRSSFSGITVNAISLDPDDTIAYSILSGSLPSGLNLNTSTGAITGTPAAVVSDTTSNFTIRATNGAQTTDRAFSITIRAPLITAFSFTGSDQTFTVPSGVSALTIAMWGAGGGSGYVGGSGGGGGAGGGAASIQGTLSVTPNETLTIRIGGGFTITTTGNGSNTGSSGSTTFGGGGAGAVGDGGGSNGDAGGTGGGASSILRSGSFIATAAGGGGGGGGGFGSVTKGDDGGAGGTGSGTGGQGRPSSGYWGANGSNGGGGGGAGGSGSNASVGAGFGGQGGANITPAGCTAYNGSSRTPGNAGSSYYPGAVGLGAVGATAGGQTLTPGNGYIVFVY